MSILKTRPSNEALQRVDEISNEAERKILEKSPTGPYILAMRAIMEKCGEQMDILTDDRLIRGDSSTSYTAVTKAEAAAKVKNLADSAEAMSTAIGKLIEKAKAIDRGAISQNQNKTLAYDNFFKEVEKEQGEVRKTIRYIREWGYVGNEGDMRNLRSNLRGMTNEHNSFIK